MARNKTGHSQINPAEKERDSHSFVGKARDELKTSSDIAFSQLFGLGSDESTQKEQHDEIQASHINVEIFNIKDLQNSAEKTQTHVETAHAAIKYHEGILQGREIAAKSEVQEMQQNIEQIQYELSRLVASSQVLKLEFAQVSVEQTTHNVGQYHVNLFEWMLSVIRTARQKVEDSNAWLGTVKGKGAKRGYWGMFKKHGTTFGLSGERAVATQVG